ncbi:MAG: sugar ABC transporter substrate-binding protein [bacterium]|nr:sugar ABC transporter substrate-binding protein [bacterium]
MIIVLDLGEILPIPIMDTPVFDTKIPTEGEVAPPLPDPEPPVGFSPEIAPSIRSSEIPSANPFIPKNVLPPKEDVVVPEPQPQPQPSLVTEDMPPPSPTRRGHGIVRRLFMIFVFLLLLAGLFFGIRFALNMARGQGKEATLVYWGLWEDDQVVQRVIQEFQKSNPKIKIQYIKQSPKQYRERLQAAVNRGDGPDVFRFHNTWVPMLQKELSAVPKTILTVSEFTNQFYPVAAADLIGGSTIYGIPMMIDGLGLYYNESIFDAHGISPPSTWEEVLNIVPEITEKRDNSITISGIALGTTNNVEHYSDILGVMFLQNGANLTNPVGKEAEEALIFYKKFTDPNDPVYTWNETLDNSVYAFATGRVAMMLAPSWRAFDVLQINRTLRFKIAPIPQLPGNTISWASYWVEGVSSESKHQKEAWEFVKFLTSKNTVATLYTEASKTRLFGEPYARVDMASSLQDDPYAGAYINQAKTSRSFPLASRTFDNGINDRLIKYLEDAVNGLRDGNAPNAVLETASSGFQQVLSSYGLSSSSPLQR